MFAVDEKVQYRDITTLSEEERFSSISSVNTSLEDPSWSGGTELICRKYLFNKENYQVFKVATVGQEVVGYSIARESEKSSNTSYLSFVVVHKGHQKKGIGSTLLDQTIEKVKSLGAIQMNLDCKEENCDFYTRFAEKRSLKTSVINRGHYANGAVKKQVTIELSEPSSVSPPIKTSA